jgi:prepilin-type N-terminal cleavage/methylation domain-containing protein
VGLPAPQRPSAPARGSTLIELIVVLALMALLFGLVPAAILVSPTEAPDRQARQRARAKAIRTGERVVVTDSLGRPTLFLPDGRVLTSARGSP